MAIIDLPKVTEQKIDKTHSRFDIEPLYPGYGATVGNSLRRVLLSSIPGAAITSFKIEGINHEFSAIPNAKEDVVELIMNLKGIYLTSFSDEPVILELSKKGAGPVTAKDFKPNSQVEVVNPDGYILTLEKDADFYMEVCIEKGTGFKAVSVEANEGKSEIGRIAVDALFSPVKRVSINVENTRVGQMTNYDKLVLDVTTNGTIEPKDALKFASAVLVDHFSAISALGVATDSEVIASNDEQENAVEEASVDSEDEDIDNKTKIEDLNLSSRTTNALLNAGIKTVGGLKRLSPLKLEEIKGLGKKGVDEINTIIE
ncbi:MAG TPA: DNA-directed RNA polymerase subunit alpha [bacterium]|nr:DNA-directed RNA polymerase subunit alpha [bacterium]